MHISDDLLVRLSTACFVVEQITGDRPHVATMHRWSTRGLRGVVLHTEYAGGHKRTKRQWIREFFASVTEAAVRDQASPPASTRATRTAQVQKADRSAEIQRADRELDAAGI